MVIDGLAIATFQPRQRTITRRQHEIDHSIGEIVMARIMALSLVMGGLVLGLQVLAARLGKVGCWDRDFEQGKHRRNGLDGSDVEVLPAAKVANVPPEVVVDAAGRACDATN